MVGLKSIGGFFAFIVGGLVAIIVGSFMIRGTMHMWDKEDETKNNNSETKNDSVRKQDE